MSDLWGQLDSPRKLGAILTHQTLIWGSFFNLAHLKVFISGSSFKSCIPGLPESKIQVCGGTVSTLSVEQIATSPLYHISYAGVLHVTLTSSFCMSPCHLLLSPTCLEILGLLLHTFPDRLPLQHLPIHKVFLSLRCQTHHLHFVMSFFPFIFQHLTFFFQKLDIIFVLNS